MIKSSQECQDVIKKINSDIDINKDFMKNPEEQYQQRNKYIEVLEYALHNNELYHLYDIWQVFARVREQATRGFFLDLWDIYEKEKSSGQYERERNILRHFVSQINDQFDEILLAKTITAPRLWQDYIQELLNDLMWIENEHEQQLQRKLLYSMSHLYTYLYPQTSISTKEEKKSLINHLEMALEGKFCRTKEGNFSIELNKVFSKNQNDNSQREFTLSFIYLYRFTSHFGVISLEDFVKEVIHSLKEEDLFKGLEKENVEELLNRLLRYWGANSPLMRFFLEEKLDFKFYEYEKREVINLSSPYGTDNFVYTIGASGVGKTYLFHAMEYFSTKHEQSLNLSIEHVDASKDSQEEDRKKWEEAEQLKERENHLIYMRSKVRNLCRFTFYEIEDTQIVEDNVTKSQSLGGYFERHLPSAIIFVFSTEEKDNLKSYGFLVNLLDRLAEQDKNYRNIPIYFIFNKSDNLLSDIDKNKQMFEDFQCYLNSSMKISEEFNFLSLRYQKEVNNKNGALGIANRTKSCCSNLAFLTQLNYDLKRVNKIINELLEKNFTNLSFIYTSSLCEPDSQYTDLQALWSDITDFIIQATSKALETYYRQEFQEKLKHDFKEVDIFYSEAKITSAFEFKKNSKGKDICEQLNEALDSHNVKDDFKNITKNSIENNGKYNPDYISSYILSLITELEPYFNSFLAEKDYCLSYLDKVYAANLRELEFVEETDIDYKDIRQLGVSSTAFQHFLEENENKENNIKKQIKSILTKILENILNYNQKCTQDKDRLNISQNDLEILLEKIILELQVVDIENREENREEVLKTSIKKKLYSNKKELLSSNNHLHKNREKLNYPQFVIDERYPSESIQNNVIRGLNEELKKQEELLIDMVIILLKNKHKFTGMFLKTYKYQGKDINLYLLQLSLKYLLKILKEYRLNVEEFQNNPEETINKVQLLKENLDKGNLKLADAKKSYRDIALEAEFDSENIDSIDKIKRRVYAVLRIYQEIHSITRDKEIRLKSLSEDIIQKFTFVKKEEYNQKLKDYQKQRKLLIFQKKISYLKQSEWIDYIEWLKRYDGILDRLPLPDEEQIKESFIKNIDTLLRTELFSH